VTSVLLPKKEEAGRWRDATWLPARATLTQSTGEGSVLVRPPAPAPPCPRVQRRRRPLLRGTVTIWGIRATRRRPHQPRLRSCCSGGSGRRGVRVRGVLEDVVGEREWRTTRGGSGTVRDSKFLMRIHGTSTRRPPLLFCTALALALLALPAAKPACFRRQLLVRQVPQGCACVRAAGGSGARHVRIRSLISWTRILTTEYSYILPQLLLYNFSKDQDPSYSSRSCTRSN
jgi:hypothetical protein